MFFQCFFSVTSQDESFHFYLMFHLCNMVTIQQEENFHFVQMHLLNTALFCLMRFLGGMVLANVNVNSALTLAAGCPRDEMRRMTV